MGDELKPVITTARYQNSTVEDAVIVPGLQAFITALPIGILAGVLAAAVHFPVNGFLVALIVFLIAFIASWLGYRGWWNALIESVLLIDLNRDGVVGFNEPEQPKVPELPIRMIEDNKHTQAFPLPFPDKAIAVAQGLARGEDLAGRTWAGPKAQGKVFSDTEWETFTKALRARDLAMWKNGEAHQQGMILTAKGRALFNELAKMGQGGVTIFDPQPAEPMQTYASEVNTEPPPPPWWGA